MVIELRRLVNPLIDECGHKSFIYWVTIKSLGGGINLLSNPIGLVCLRCFIKYRKLDKGNILKLEG